MGSERPLSIQGPQHSVLYEDLRLTAHPKVGAYPALSGYFSHTAPLFPSAASPWVVLSDLVSRLVM